MRVALFLFLLVTLPAAGRVRAVRHPGGAAVPAPRSVLWIAAHPDDEAVAAPLLAKWCLDDEARCAFLILTRGDSGLCLLAEGCLPDVASVRSAEAASAAELFHADSILLRFPDGGGVAPPQWPSDAVLTIARYIEAVRPELILTFDPRHGTTCHPDHRETGRLVMNAVRLLSFDTELYFLETRVDFATLSFTSATPFAVRFDATQTWNTIVADMRRHPSQFDQSWIDAILNVPPHERAVYLAPSEQVLGLPVAGCE